MFPPARNSFAAWQADGKRRERWEGVGWEEGGTKEGGGEWKRVPRSERKNAMSQSGGGARRARVVFRGTFCRAKRALPCPALSPPPPGLPAGTQVSRR
jgi:hypothetical protein